MDLMDLMDLFGESKSIQNPWIMDFMDLMDLMDLISAFHMDLRDLLYSFCIHDAASSYWSELGFVRPISPAIRSL